MNNTSSPSPQDQSPAEEKQPEGLQKLPTLRIVDLSKVHLHELHDNQRTPPLVESLNRLSILTNPPIVTPMQFEDCYMVLDGANRISAFREIGLKHALVQIMEPDDSGLKMHSWNHVIWEMPPQDLINAISAIEGFKISQMDDPNLALQLIRDKELLFYFQTPDLKVHAVKSMEDKKSNRLEQLHAVTNTYKENAKLDRTPLRTIDSLLGLYDELTAVLIFPHFSVFDVLEICIAGKLMPAGITRSVISPRALRVNYPVKELEKETSLEEKNKVFTEWLQGRLAKRGVRYYQEPTMIFDE